MTQLEEYQAHRKTYTQIVAQCREAEKNQALPSQERHLAEKRRKMYTALIAELDEQIRALDPSARRRKPRKPRGLGKRRKSLDEIYSHGEKCGDRIASTTDTYSFDDTEVLSQYLAEIIPQLTRRQAEAVYYRDQLGLTFAECGKRMYGDVPSPHSRARWAYVSAKQNIRIWIRTRMAVDSCNGPKGFDWDVFLDKTDVLPPLGKDLLLACIDAPEEFQSVSALARYFHRSRHCVRVSLVRVQKLCKSIHIPLSALPPLFQRKNTAPCLKTSPVRKILVGSHMPPGIHGKR